MKKAKIILLIIGIFPVLIFGYYFSALFSSTVPKNTIYTMMDRYQLVKAFPFENYFSKYTVIVNFFLLLIYFLMAIIVIFGEKTRRPNEEQGSSKWESPQRITKLLSDRSTDPKDPMNLVVFKMKKTNFIIRFFRDLFYKLSTRKLD